MADIDWMERHKQLTRAARRGNCEQIDGLIEEGVDVNYVGKRYGWTALIWASNLGYVQIVRSLLRAEADVNMIGENGSTALVEASVNQHTVIVALLLEAGADVPNTGNEDVEREIEAQIRSSGKQPKSKTAGTLLVNAARRGSSEEIAHLLADGVDVNYAGKCGWTALKKAIVAGHDEVQAQLLAAGAVITEKDKRKLMERQLVDAAKGGDTGGVSRMIHARVDVNAGVSGGFTALMAASQSGRVSIVKALLEADAEVNRVCEGGSHALMHASNGGHASIAFELILAGACISAANHKGETAAQWALNERHQDLAMVLNAATCPPTAAVSTPQTAHFLAAGIPLQQQPQPLYHTIAHHENLLLTEIGPWLHDVALPQAATNTEVKELIFTLISHTYTLSHTNPRVANTFFNDFVIRSAQSQQDCMPSKLDEIAKTMGVDVALAPATLRDTPETRVEVSQDTIVAFMKPEQRHVAEAVLAECAPKFVKMQKEAKAAVADLANPKTGGVGHSETYEAAQIHSLPTVPEVFVAALCVVSTFIFNHLQATRPDLCKGKCNFGDIRWPAVKTMLRMFAKLSEDYADLDRPWAALLDTVRFSLISKMPAQHVQFVEGFIPEACSTRRDPELTVVRAKSTLDVPDAAVKQELWNLVYRPSGLTFGSMVGEQGRLDDVQVDRWSEYGDVQTVSIQWAKQRRGSNLAVPDCDSHITSVAPRNPLFAAALATAKEANSAVSPYVWDPALQLIAHPSFAAQPVAMVIEMQLYLEEFLTFRKAVHCFYKITRAQTLASLAQDCRKYAKNPEIAFDTLKLIEIEKTSARFNSASAAPDVLHWANNGKHYYVVSV